ncbi:tRNA (adenosine(37)-N6)-threonylcarbamoyltransferase complex transferase subunit TsaD [Patescibacteria group bacterium]|nr:tRNA (adenosine(37)-N6)-threonylcarbamoyltransferase complex transferase subunit TsaD [Patescibacteria group bacterium]
MKILAIETSCDETAASVLVGEGDDIKILSNIVSSQIQLHATYGGVVPELAAREHVVNIIPVIDKALSEAGMSSETASSKLDVIAVTIGPGLITSLQVGVETAKVLSYIWKVPLVAVNHIEGHIYSNFIDVSPVLPALILTVSGGHTSLVMMSEHGKCKVIGETVDDAAGEAFDKAAKMMSLGYPGGPIVSKQAAIFQKTGQDSSIRLPRPMLYSKNNNFSFSGLKTALLYKIQKDTTWKERVPEYCYEFEQAIIDTLIYKTIKAAKANNINIIMLAGGVSANNRLRIQLKEMVRKQLPNAKLYIPDLKYTTDNAAMIAVAGYYKALRKEFTPWQILKTSCNLEL